MRLGINILYLIPNEVGGTETYARNLIPALGEHLAGCDELIIFASRETAPTFSVSPNIKIITLPFFACNRIARIVFEQTLLPLYCLRYKIDLLFSLGYSQPIFLPCKSVVTIHDLNWYYHPEDFPLPNRLMWNLLTRLTARATNHIITDSKYSRDSMRKVLGMDSSKITSILHAAPPKLEPDTIQLNDPYLFTVVAGHPHKNLITLVKAFKLLSPSYPKLKLVVAGLGGKADQEIKAYLSVNNLHDKVKILGYVKRSELASLYSSAAVFVFPSAYEGFGYPVLEAMSYGVPVVSSGATSLSEVVGSGGVLVRPFDIAGYVKSIINLLDSKSLREDYINKGRKRVAQLSWDQCASETFKIIKATISA